MGLMGLIGPMVPIKSHRPNKSHKSYSYFFSRGLAQSLFALLPIAWAKLISLQHVEQPEDFIHVASYRQIVDRHPANDAFGIDDICRAQRHALTLVEDAQR